MSGGGAGLMSCVREGSLEPPYRPHTDTHNHGEGRTGRFLRGLRRMFKRRGSGTRNASPDPRSSSTGELLAAERQARRKEGAYGSGLSVSHDSVFTGERSDESSDERPTPNLPTSHRAELVAAVRRRGRGDGSDDDEDLGLPRSPPASPPTDKADKRHHAGISQSSCSDGSLLSVGSSEMDEDSSSYHHDHSNRSDHSDVYNLSEPALGVAPLSHSAAKHKMAVRPRRTHGAPRRKKTNPIAASALPITPELNEEMVRSTTPEVIHKTSEVVTESFSSSTTTKHHVPARAPHHQQPPARRKSSSLPPGLALGQLIGHSPAKLSIAEQNTPRSSIKRSKSSSQGQNLRDDNVTTSETQISSSQERVTKYRSDNKYAEESCHEKKSKSEKKIENEVIRSSKKEESFFSRLLLRKSGKKSKKDQPDGEGENKKSKTEKSTAQYKAMDTERSGFVYVDHGQGHKPVPAERTHKSAGQKVFANQMHKRMDNKGAYVQEGVYKDVYSAAKVPGVEYNITDLKIAEETDKMLNQEMKARLSRRDDFNEKMERSKRTSSKETVEDKRESFSLNHDKSKRPASVQRLVDPFSSKAFINNELSNIGQEENLSPTLEISDEEPPIRAHRMKSVHSDYMFHSGSMPKNIPYFNHSVVMSASVSPPKNILHQSSENVKHIHRSSDHVCELRDKHEKREKAHRASKTEEAYVNSGLRSLGDEYVETRSSIGKSHSFRYASESPSISSQESQMPSLPAIVGISEPLLESWEVNYRRNVSERHDYTKRVSARNYSILHGTAEANYDSLPSTDSSYMDSLKTDMHDDKKLFSSSIQIGMDSHKRDSDISQIEAKIDDIISSPKPIMAPILKSSSLDSVKSSPEKQVEDRRKTISVESALSQGGRISNNMIQKEKQEAENYISVTMINKENTPIQIKTDTPKMKKSDEKLQQSGTTKPGVPEFLNIQLNRVDAKPTTNVVLTANITPKKIDSPQVEKEIETFEVIENKSQKNSVVSKVESVSENTQIELKSSPIVVKKATSQPPLTPQSPSTPKAFFKRKSTSVDMQDRPDKPRTNSLSTEGSTEKIYDNISMDRKSHSSFGSKSSIQSTDSNDIRTPDRNEETVVYRKKPVILSKELRTSERRNDDEPELMKVFARRSLKLKDCEAETLAQEIAEGLKEDHDNANRSKLLKNEFNASIKSRDSDKENDDTSSKTNEENRMVDIAARVSQFGVPHYQRSVSINSVSNPKRESAPVYKSEANKYKKEVSDSTPEKRLRNRTFPDPSNDREDIKNITKSEAMAYKADTLSKRPWQRKDDDKRHFSVEKEKRESGAIEKEADEGSGVREKAGAREAAEAAPQFKGILHMRAQWERRAQQGMTK